MSTMSTKETSPPEVLTVKEGASYLRVSVGTIRRLIREGDVPHARVGNSIRLRKVDLDAYVEGNLSRDWSPVDGRGRASGA